MPPGDVDVRPITSEDRPALARFSCRAYGEPWSDVIEEMISEHLAGALGHDGLAALGLWDGAHLCAVIAWRIDEPARVCRVALLAVENGYRRNGFGRRLKEEVLGLARRAGAVAVASIVHWDNDPMIELNAALGANVERIDGDPDHCLCVIPV
jgi:GNAT superfamily N-acetyltransferase